MYIDFNDDTIPIGKRKQAYVKWAVSKGTSLKKAKIQANKKFGFKKTDKKLLIICVDYGRFQQKSFKKSEIYEGYNLKKYSEHNYVVYDFDKHGTINELKSKAEMLGWSVFVEHFSA